jgi:hypothetical protein
MAPSETPADGQRHRRPERTPSYRPWAELLARTFVVDVLDCPKCHGRMRLLAMVEDPASVARFLAAVGEATEVPRRSPGRRARRRNFGYGTRVNDGRQARVELLDVVRISIMFDQDTWPP